LTEYTKTGKNIPYFQYINIKMKVKFTIWQYYIQNGHKINQPFPS
jgi:hypothetical protein